MSGFRGLAFSTLACPAWSLDQVIEAARAYGYDGVELRLLDGELIEPTLPDAERERAAGALRRAGLPVAALDTSLRLAAAPDAGRAEADLLAFLRMAHDLEAPVVRVFGGEWPEDRTRVQAIGQVRRLLEAVAPEADRLGVAVALETHDAFASAAIVAEAVSGAGGGAGALWDTHHPYRVGEAPEQVLGALGGRVRHVHVKDARRRPDGGWDLVPLGEGEVPVRACLEALRGAGYQGWVSVEWEKKWHPEIAEPEVALPQHANLLREWLGAASWATG